MVTMEREPAQATTDREEPQLVCGKCNVPLKMEKVTMNYLNHQLKHDFPKCPKCGQVYISEDIVNGKMKEVEMTLEDK